MTVKVLAKIDRDIIILEKKLQDIMQNCNVSIKNIKNYNQNDKNQKEKHYINISHQGNKLKQVIFELEKKMKEVKVLILSTKKEEEEIKLYKKGY